MVVGLIGLGALFVGLAVMLLTEYRKAFLSDPSSIMSIEVLFAILRLGGPGYLAVLALMAGLPMLLGGSLALVLALGFIAFDSAGNLWRAIGLTLGAG